MKLSDVTEEKPKALKLSDIDADIPVPSAEFRQRTARGGPAKVEPTIGGKGETSKSRRDFNLGEIGTAAGVGYVAGVALPEILEIAGGMTAGLPKPFSNLSPFLLRAAPLVGGSLVTRGLGGFASGGISEAGGQVYEMFSEPGLGAEATRIVLGGVPVSTFSNFVTGTAGKAIRGISKLFKSQDDLLNLSKDVAKQRQQAINSLRGEGAGPETYQTIFNQIKSGVDTDVGILNAKAAQISAQAENYALQLIQQGEQAASSIKGGAQVTAASISEKFAQRLSQFKMANESEALAVLERAKNTAQDIRNAAAGKAKDQRGKMYQEADRIEKDTQQQVQEFLRTTDTEVTRLRSLLDKTRRRAETSRGYVDESVSKIGKPLTETELGQAARGPAETQFNQFKKIRGDQMSGAEAGIFNAAKTLEKQGQTYQSTNTYKSAIKYLQDLLIDPDTKRASITVPQLETQIKNVLKSLKGKEKLVTNEKGEEIVTIIPGDFQSLEYLRRFMGDRASGVPSEGFDAIGQGMAGDIKKMVQGIQDEFISKGGQTKPWTEYLEAYRKASIPINDYKSELGSKLLGKTEWDASKYAADAADIGKSVFKSHGSVEAYRALSKSSDKELEQLGRQFIANEIVNQGTNAKTISRYEWLKFPPFNELKNDVDKLAQREQLSGKTAQELFVKIRERATKGLQEGLRTAPEKIEEIVTKGQGARQKSITKARPQVTETIEEAKKAGQQAISSGGKEATALVKEIPKQEKRLATEMRGEQKVVGVAATKESATVIANAKDSAKQAVEQANVQRAIPDADAKALSSALDALTETPKTAFERIAFGSDPVGQLRAFAPYIKQTKQGLEDYQKALLDGIASRIGNDPEKLIRLWNDVLSPANVGAGLISKSAANEVSQQLMAVQRIQGGTIQKLGAMERFIVNMIRNEVYQGIVRPYVSLTGD